jgi:formylglycine-generating enzyme required for sulfatase activity
MKPGYMAWMFFFFMLPALDANAAGAMLRITCEEDDVGAEVTINGKFRGECPVDLKVSAGKLKLLVRKGVDAEHERVFEQDIRMGEDSSKRISPVLIEQLTAKGRRQEQERIRQVKAAEQRAEVERRRQAKEVESERLRLAEETRRAAEEAERLRPAQVALMLKALKQQGIEPGNGKPFRDCPDCPEMVLIPHGSFDMGSNNDDWSEKPAHRVSIVKPFALGKTEVTQRQWKAIMGNNPSRFSECGDDCPVEKVSWYDIQEFIRKLNASTGKQYRLPTEAEWEYACRAGEQQQYCGSDDINLVAWYDKNSGAGMFSKGHTHPVAKKQANPFGLYDMNGNVWEWMEDSYHESYDKAPSDGSQWAGDGATRVLRGGSWNSNPRGTRVTFRGGVEPSTRYNDIGFRLARMLP